MSQLKLVNRQAELRFLQDQYSREQSGFLVISGRRRVGKTTLLISFIEGKPGIYFLASQEGYLQNIRALARLMGQYLKDPLFERGRFAGWPDLFSAFVHHTGFADSTDTKKVVLVIDEFPYLVDHNPAVPSAFQIIWDQILKDCKVLLILSGSSISTMETAVLGYASPLYGRRTGQWQVEPLPFEEISHFLPYPAEELVMTWCVLGGIPGYLNKFDPARSFRQNVLEQVLNKGAYLYNEADLLMNYEFREPANYLVIFRAIAGGCMTLSRICSETGLDKSMVSKYLNVLVRLHILHEEVPVTAHTGFRKRNYRITDPYLHFWFRFVAPNRIDIEAQRDDAVMHRVMEGLPAYCGSMFEVLVQDLIRRGRILGDRHFTRIGRWWYKEAEIDCVALDDESHSIVFCECKWQGLSYREAREVLEDLRTKAQDVRWHNGDRKEEYCLVARKIAGKDRLKSDGFLTCDLKDLVTLPKKNLIQ